MVKTGKGRLYKRGAQTRIHNNNNGADNSDLVSDNMKCQGNTITQY